MYSTDGLQVEEELEAAQCRQVAIDLLPSRLEPRLQCSAPVNHTSMQYYVPTWSVKLTGFQRNAMLLQASVWELYSKRSLGESFISCTELDFRNYI